jgi:hypothetical protein
MILYFVLGCKLSVEIIDSNSPFVEKVVVGGSTTLSSDKHWKMKDIMKVQPALDLLSMPVSNDSIHSLMFVVKFFAGSHSLARTCFEGSARILSNVIIIYF